MRAPLPSILLLAVACVVSGKSANDLQVTEVRYWTVGDCTRIAIQTNGEFTYKWDRLTNPDRLFFDIVDARPNVDGRRFSTRQVNDKFLKQIRVAETLPGRTRVVLDLNRPVDFNVSQLGNPDRLMIELRAAPVQKTPADAASGPVGGTPVTQNNPVNTTPHSLLFVAPLSGMLFHQAACHMAARGYRDHFTTKRPIKP